MTSISHTHLCWRSIDNISHIFWNFTCLAYVNIPSDILPDRLSGTLSGILSTITSGILPGVLSSIQLWHTIWHLLWHTPWHAIWYIAWPFSCIPPHICKLSISLSNTFWHILTLTLALTLTVSLPIPPLSLPIPPCPSLSLPIPPHPPSLPPSRPLSLSPSLPPSPCLVWSDLVWSVCLPVGRDRQAGLHPHPVRARRLDSWRACHSVQGRALAKAYSDGAEGAGVAAGGRTRLLITI